VPPPAIYAASGLKGTNHGSSMSSPWIFLKSYVYRSCRILRKYVWIYNKYRITLNIVTYKLLRAGLIIVVRKQPNVQVMGFDPVLFFCNIESNVTTKLTRKTYEKREIVSYLPLGIADVTVRPVVVHQLLALSVQSVLL
jgi:hypothetical protein